MLLRKPVAETAIRDIRKEFSGVITPFTITAEIHARSLANFYCQYAGRHMNLKFMRHVSERERAIRNVLS